MSAKAGAGDGGRLKPELVDDPTLPAGWFAAKNEDGEVYYFNEDNGEVRFAPARLPFEYRAINSFYFILKFQLGSPWAIWKVGDLLHAGRVGGCASHAR